MCLKEIDFDIIQREKGKSVIQVDYRFYLVDELSMYAEVFFEIQKSFNHYFGLDNSFEIGFIEDNLFGRNRNNKLDKIKAVFSEVNFVGHTRVIFQKMNFDYNLNFSKYVKEKKEFIKRNPNFKFQVDELFNENVTNLTNFFLCSEKQLLKIDTSNFIKRFQFNINNKLK